MAKKNDKNISGSVQAKNGHLYFVAGYKDPVTQKRKTKWMTLGLDVGAQKSLINQAKWKAQLKFEEQYRRMADGYDDPANYRLIPFLDEWLDRVHKHKIQVTTYGGYKQRVRKMEKFFGDKITLADCKPRLIHKFYDELRDEGDSEQTVLHYHNLLHTAFEYAVRQEIFEVNPMKRVERPQPEKFEGGFYSVDEVKTLLALTQDDKIYIPIVLAVYCGLRRSEALGVSWSNVDFENDTIYINQKVSSVMDEAQEKRRLVIAKQMKNDTSRRSFRMIPEVKEILLAHREKQERYKKQFRKSYSKKYLDMVCVDPLGELIKPDYVTTHFPDLLKKYGLRRIRFHDLRHTCASLLVSAGISMKVIQAYMGHSNMSTTADIYSHLDANATREAGKILGEMLSKTEG